MNFSRPRPFLGTRAPSTAPASQHRAWFSALFMALSLAFPLSAGAQPAKGTTVTGQITEYHPTTRKVTLIQDNGERLSFYITKSTKINANLKTGSQVKTNLHRPIFGPAFARQITLLAAASDTRP